ncbi:GNAT family N-acetyltransferase [Kribbella soli]|uniref:GNAT family N-acetyltransferase n=1 Tax=Kribbella soli TaxID=1124743 RepID=A0A4V2LYD6_9ACTN|nr:GNAT family N-acetyltransferase [Kribbella soli]TCC03926.1 GNAT family N-acetyltransferase [Kribbella soli]
MNDVVIRRATASDVAAIVAMIADDQLGATRESLDDLTPYLAAFEQIDADPNQLLVVADRNDDVIGTLQLTIIPGLSRRGSTRGLIEAVRVAAPARGCGLGSTLVRWAVEESRIRGCTLVQLTSDKSRTEAHRFYTNLGFTNSHEGFKLKFS